MMEEKSATPAPIAKIIIQPDGPLTVEGNVPLVRKRQVVSENGEPLTWRKEGAIPCGATYDLCRCGQSREYPFCDGSSHAENFFDGGETADSGFIRDRKVEMPGGTRIVVFKDSSLCMESGFCGFELKKLEQMVAETGNTQVRALVMAMIERCPSGALTYAIDAGSGDVEPDLPIQIAVTVEITSDGPIAGPLWVTGGIPIERTDGKPVETRNRVTLCNCGESKNRPFCDGAHRKMASRKIK